MYMIRKYKFSSPVKEQLHSDLNYGQQNLVKENSKLIHSHNNYNGILSPMLKEQSLKKTIFEKLSKI